MAKPQKENGYTPVANEILDEICRYGFNGSQLRIIIKVWRLTYGYNRKDHEFSKSFLQEVTGLSESAVKKEVAALLRDRVLILVQKETQNSARRLAFNKNYEEWNVPRSGDSMNRDHDLFSNTEGYDCDPQQPKSEGYDCDPREGYNCDPQNTNPGGTIVTPYKEIRSLKKSIKEKESMFESFYSLYPRKVNQAYAEKTWKKHCKDEAFDPDLVIVHTRNFVETCKLLKTAPKFIPHASTYLNQKRYEDYPSVDPEGIASNKQSTLDLNLDFLRKQIGGDRSGQGPSSASLGEGSSGLPE